MKKTLFAIALALASTACHKDPTPESNQPSEDHALMTGTLIIDGDTLAITGAYISTYDNMFEHTFVPEQGRPFAIVSASPLESGTVAFTEADSVYDGKAGVVGIRPSTCAPEFYTQGTLQVQRQADAHKLDFDCATPSGSRIEGHYDGRLAIR